MVRGTDPDVSDDSSDTLTLYLREVRRGELFTPEQEFETATLARAGDFAARQSMIEHNLRLVVSVAKPRSAIFAWPSTSKILSGLTSRCTIPREWA